MKKALAFLTALVLLLCALPMAMADEQPDITSWILAKDPAAVSGTVRFWIPFKGSQGMDDMIGGGKIIKAEVPLSEMFGYSTTLRSATQGRATYTMEFKHYSEAPKNVADAIVASRAK